MADTNNSFNVDLKGNNTSFDAAIKSSEAWFNKFAAAMNSKMDRVGKSIDHAGAKFAVMNNVVNAGFSLAGRAFEGLAGGIATAIKNAGDLNEVANYTKQVFGDSFGSINAFADKFSKKFGVAKAEVLDLSAQFGELAMKNGMNADQASKFAEKMVKRASDVASLKNSTTKEVGDRLISTLVGNHEAGRTAGVFISEDRLKDAAAKKGAKGELSGNDKFNVRASLIMQDTQVAEGDLERTSGGLNNQLKIASGNVTNLATEFGANLIPACERVLNKFNELAGSLFESLQSGVAKQWAEGFSSAFETVSDWAVYLLSNIKPVADFLMEMGSTISVVYRNWGLIAERTGVMVQGWITNAGETFSWLGSVIGTFLDWFGANWKTIFVDAFKVVTTGLSNLAKNFADLGSAFIKWIQDPFHNSFEFNMTPLMEGLAPLQSEALKLPELMLTNFGDQLAAVDEKMVQAEQKRLDEIEKAKKPVAVGKKPGENKDGEKKGLLAAPDKTKTSKTVESFGIADFGKHLQTSLGKDDTAKDALKEAKKQTALQEKLVTKNNNAVALMANSD